MMTLVRVSKQDKGAETEWTGGMPAERVRKAIADAITSELGLGIGSADVTVGLYTPLVGHEISFSVVRDHDHWRKQVEAQGQKAAYEDATAR